jgi:hypothetical protein
MEFRSVKGVDTETGVKAEMLINLRVDDGKPSHSEHF